jgi:hypothetical protein
MTEVVINTIQINPYENFCFGLRSKETQRQYPKILDIFLNYALEEECLSQSPSLEDKCLALHNLIKENPGTAQQKVTSFVNHSKKKVFSGSY